MKKLNATFASLFATMLVPATAIGADVSQIQVLGFSPDAKVFAFEEFGIQDGSGFPYSTIYLIDTDKDAYLPGSPYRVVVDDSESGDELLPVSAARKKSAEAAAEALATYKIADNPGILGAFNPLSEIGVSSDTLSYYAIQTDRPFGGPYTLNLETIPFPTPENCDGLSDVYGGIRLRFTQQDGVAGETVVYTDDHVPQSRGCVGGYRLGGVALTGENDGPHMALIEVRKFGFEGFDHTWFAVPVRTHP